MSRLSEADPTNAAPESFRRYRLTVAEYRAMSEHVVLAPEARMELVDGKIIEMPPIGITHAGVVDHLVRLLVRAVGERAVVRVRNPIELPEHSMPQPDLEGGVVLLDEPVEQGLFGSVTRVRAPSGRAPPTTTSAHCFVRVPAGRA